MPNNNPNTKVTMNLHKASKEIQSYIQAFNDSFLYREQEIIILAVSLIIGKNACFIGSHGEAKSALIEQFAKGIDKKFFGCQFNRFSTPDEILGHFSLAEMKNNDQYVRKYQGKLPDAQIAYLDECFNASGAMLQSLQKALNEKRIDLGNGTELSIPMELSIASTNFHCSKNPQLAAFWDRFFLRIETQNTTSQMTIKSYKKFMRLKRSGKLGKVDQKLDNQVIEFFRSQLEWVSITDSMDRKVFEIIDLCIKNNIEISARRLVWIDNALRAMALINGRNFVNEEDLSILQHCLWIHIEQYDIISSFLKKVCHSPIKELKIVVSDLEKMKLDYLQIDNEFITTRNSDKRSKLLEEQKMIEDGMEAKIKDILQKNWPYNNPEVQQLIDDIKNYSNPSKFIG